MITIKAVILVRRSSHKDVELVSSKTLENRFELGF